ncbi:MAG: hypothetical protein KA817_08960 [Flavobacteriales bacterium]|nr:hypothetical protein [Flavobacteriales bacterium]
MPVVDHPVTIAADPSTIVWKYFKRQFFDDLIANEALFFRRVIDFALTDDPFEGTITCVDKHRDKWRALASPNLDISSLKMRVEMAESIDGFGMRAGTVINSWTMHEKELEHMWRIYADAHRDQHGVAIWSTVGQITKALSQANENVYASRIRYIDYENEPFYKKGEYEHGTWNVMVPLIHKHAHGYLDEREFRLLHQYAGGGNPEEWWTDYGSCRGHKIRVDLAELISGIVVSPWTTTQQKDEIRSLCVQKGVFAPVNFSKRSIHRGCP